MPDFAVRYDSLVTEFMDSVANVHKPYSDSELSKELAASDLNRALPVKPTGGELKRLTEATWRRYLGILRSDGELCREFIDGKQWLNRG